MIERLCTLSSSEILYFFLNEGIIETLESCGLQFIRHGFSRYLSQADTQLVTSHFQKFELMIATLFRKCLIAS